MVLAEAHTFLLALEVPRQSLGGDMSTEGLTSHAAPLAWQTAAQTPHVGKNFCSFRRGSTCNVRLAALGLSEDLKILLQLGHRKN